MLLDQEEAWMKKKLHHTTQALDKAVSHKLKNKTETSEGSHSEANSYSEGVTASIGWDWREGEPDNHFKCISEDCLGGWLEGTHCSRRSIWKHESDSVKMCWVL